MCFLPVFVSFFYSVIPAKAGIQKNREMDPATLDSRFRGNDE